ncbi:hypothetical protein [Aeoliella sp.]|uniref:hypothetical protein n=1 Tax=Aeoliella sp. TaxID=2795800 RepID=UPI003CCBC5BB
MREDLIAYALGELDDDDRLRIESALAEDPELRDELEQIRDCLGDPECESRSSLPPIPRGLADRTTATVLAGCDESEDSTPRASLGLAAASGFMTPMDMTVALGILLAVGSLLAPALYSVRNQSQSLSCKNNLRQLGQLLTRYSEDNNGYFPLVGPDEHVGIFASRLREADYMQGEAFDQLFICPDSSFAEQIEYGDREFHVPTMAELAVAKGPWLKELKQMSAGGYAYQPGYVQGNRYLPARNRRNCLVPVLADEPSLVANYQTGANHGGDLVNTLFQDGSVQSLDVPLVPRVNDHLFVNHDGEPTLSDTWNDAVVLRSSVSPRTHFPTQQMPERLRLMLKIQIRTPAQPLQPGQFEVQSLPSR